MDTPSPSTEENLASTCLRKTRSGEKRERCGRLEMVVGFDLSKSLSNFLTIGRISLHLQTTDAGENPGNGQTENLRGVAPTLATGNSKRRQRSHHSRESR